VVLFFFSSLVLAQNEAINEIKAFVNDQNKQYKDPNTSPLPKKDRKRFQSLDYFSIDLKYRIEVRFERTPNELPFVMETNTGRQPIYIKYGELHFQIDGKALKLNVYQNQNLIFEAAYKDYLFLPFTDLTSGISSYGGGRYIDMKIPTSEKLVLDFNQSYNPYCAYGKQYSCPIPPIENYLDVEINAGIKTYNKD
jgi:hypothetical protein